MARNPSAAADPTPDNLQVAGDEKEIARQREQEMKAGRSPAASEKAVANKDPEKAHRSFHVQLDPRDDSPTSIVPDQLTRRSDSDVAYGTFVTVGGSGEHAGKYGVFNDILTSDKDGYPDQVVVDTRDDNHERIVVSYKDLSAARAGRR